MIIFTTSLFALLLMPPTDREPSEEWEEGKM